MINSNFSLKPNSVITENDQSVDKVLFQPPFSPATMIQNLNLEDDISPQHLHNSRLSFFQQFDDHTMENGNYKNLLESSNGQDRIELKAFNSSTEGYDQEDVDTFQKSMLINTGSASADAQTIINTPVEPNVKSKKRQNDDRDSMNRSDSVSECSDQNDDEENNDAKYRRRNGKGGAHQCKNLEAERKRRKKLNERLYNLRSLVPKITKLDRASILGDAIEYVMELKQQVTDLQNELERNIDDGPSDHQRTEVVHGSLGTEVSNKKNQNSESTHDHKVQQMEPQVEVTQLDGNELFVKVFCEHKTGGFVKLIKAFSSLGLQVTNVNVTSLLSLVLNVFKVEWKDCDTMETADHVRESLLELAAGDYHHH